MPCRRLEGDWVIRERNWIRHTLEVVLFATAAVLLVASQFLIFGRTTVFNADRFADRSVEALEEPAVRAAVTEQIVDRIVADGEPDLVAVRPLLISVTEAVVQTNAFKQVYRNAVKQTHSSVFEGNRDSLVVLVSNAVVLVSTALEKVNPAVARQIPKDVAANIVRVSNSEWLTDAAATARSVRQGAVVSLVLAIVALFGAIAVAKRRFRAIRVAGAIIAGSAGIVLLIDLLVQGYLFGQVDELYLTAANDAYDVMTAPLQLIASIYLATGLVMIAATVAVTKPADLERSIGSILKPFADAVMAPATTRKGLLIRAAASLVIGLIFVGRPLLVLKALVAVVGILLLAQAVRDVTAAVVGPRELAAEAAIERGAGHRVLWPYIATGVAFVVAFVLVATWPTGDDGIVKLGSRTACNGAESICDRPLARTTLAATHNSMSAADDRDWFFPEQNHGIVKQLDDGVRGLLIDVYYGYPGRRVLSDIDFNDPGAKNEAIRSFGPEFVAAAERLRSQIARPEPGTKKQLYLCHGFCELGALPLVPTLERIRTWLDTNPRDVVVIVLEDYVPGEAVVEAFAQAGLDDFLYNGEITPQQPTLRSMIESGQRLMVFGENLDKTYGGWYRPAFDYIQETPYDFGSISRLTCEPNRGEPDNPLFLLNNWISTPPNARPSNAVRVNNYRFLLDRARKCEKERGLQPSMLAVDFYRNGDVVRVAETLNKRK